MNSHISSLPARRALLLLLTALALSALALLALPGLADAQSACPLAPRLHYGDAVEVIDGTANRLRHGPGLGFGVMHIKMVPGDVWYVQEGPVCASGINWYRVAAHDADGWTAEGEYGKGYYIAKTWRRGGDGVTPTCVSARNLTTGMTVMVGDSKRQHLRVSPQGSAAHIDWLYPDVPVTIVSGPQCAGGWVWWYVRDHTGKLQGWTSEGDGPNIPWLVPARVYNPGAGNSAFDGAFNAGSSAGAGSTGSSAGGSTGLSGSTATAVQPLFSRSFQASNPADISVVFSPDSEVATVMHSKFEVATGPGKLQGSQTETITLPVRSGRQGYRSETAIVGTAFCPTGSWVAVTMQVNAASKTFLCESDSPIQDMEMFLNANHSAGDNVNITVTAQVWQFAADADAAVFVDVIETALYPR